MKTSQKKTKDADICNLDAESCNIPQTKQICDDTLDIEYVWELSWNENKKGIKTKASCQIMMKSQVKEAKIVGIFDHYELKWYANFCIFGNYVVVVHCVIQWTKW